ncbi:hypothetical protein, partial [Salmonella enterica]|uniref:hypothetical protein n=1 Tax=Salmonella enterica TaxID=28901 RepID=UPI000ABF51B6
IGQIDQHLRQTQQKKMDHSRLVNQNGSLMSQLGSYTDQHTQIEKSITQLGYPDISSDQARLEVIKNELGTVQIRLREIRAMLETSKQHAGRLETLKEGFKEIKSYVFTNALNELNYRTNQYLN